MHKRILAYGWVVRENPWRVWSDAALDAVHLIQIGLISQECAASIKLHQQCCEKHVFFLQLFLDHVIATHLAKCNLALFLMQKRTIFAFQF